MMWIYVFIWKGLTDESDLLGGSYQDMPIESREEIPITRETVRGGH